MSFEFSFVRRLSTLGLALVGCVIYAAPIWAADPDASNSSQGQSAILDDIHATAPTSSLADNSAAQAASPATIAPHNTPSTPAPEPLPSTPSAPPSASASTSSDAVSNTPMQATPPAKSPNAVVNLVNLLVQQGVIKKENGEALVQQAESDAAEARAQQQAPAPSSPSPAIADNNDVNVDYVPAPVEAKIRSDIKQDVMDQAREENWAAPRQFPEWLSRISFFGDVRFRTEGDFYPPGNATGIPNFNAINTGNPYNRSSNSTQIFPSFNTDQDRDRLRVRARFGVNADLGTGFTSGFRIATGSDDSPVTENQTLGAASGQGGDFSKYAVWVDRAFIKKTFGGGPTDPYEVSVTVGRFDNPFFSTSLIFADDLGFDGAVVQAKYQVADGVTPFFSGGVFPVFNTDLNFGTASNPSGEAFGSEDKWLYAAQLGTIWKINEDFSLKVAGAFYDYQNVQGKVSDPILASTLALDPGYVGSTDDTRPSFAQNGNTYIELRNIVQNVPGATYDYQYYGLASGFQEAVVTGQLDFSRFDPFHISLTGEAVKNLAFDKSAIESESTGPQNNFDPNGYAGGDMGYLLRLNLGKVALEKLWDWNVNVGYRYVQSDATLDGFNDADFGGALTGTNLKGYTIGANLALNPRVWLGVHFYSADTIVGPPVKSDVIQFDINAKY